MESLVEIWISFERKVYPFSNEIKSLGYQKRFEHVFSYVTKEIFIQKLYGFKRLIDARMKIKKKGNNISHLISVQEEFKSLQRGVLQELRKKNKIKKYFQVYGGRYKRK